MGGVGEFIQLPIRTRDSCCVYIRGDLEQGIRWLKKEVEKAAVLREVRDRRNYITRKQRRILKEQRAAKRMRKSRRRFSLGKHGD